MKNDFREFYDENYIMHKAVDILNEDELMHGEWLNKFRRYVDKVKTASGKWRYIYPEDLKKTGEKIKRDVSYTARNLKSKITGRNDRFKDSAAGTLGRDGHIENRSGRPTAVNTKKHIALNYAKEQKKGGIGMSKYAERRQKEIEKEKQNKKVESFNTNLKRAKEEVRNRQDKAKSQGLKPASYHIRTDGLGYKRKKAYKKIIRRKSSN